MRCSRCAPHGTQFPAQRRLPSRAIAFVTSRDCGGAHRPRPAVDLAPAWLEEPAETDPPTTTLAWLFDDAFLCGRALSREKLRVRLRRGDEGRRIDVVIPVYRGEAETRACIESVLASAGTIAHEVVVINDAGPEPALAQWLRGLATQGRITLIEHGANRGFVATANEGMGLHRDRTSCS
jgi:hypothetical protein